MYFNFAIFNFFFKKSVFDKFLFFHRPLWKNKYLEFELDYHNYYLFKFEIDLHPIGKDHGGLGIELNVLGYSFDFKIYDSRHWDHENRCWEEK